MMAVGVVELTVKLHTAAVGIVVVDDIAVHGGFGAADVVAAVADDGSVVVDDGSVAAGSAAADVAVAICAFALLVSAAVVVSSSLSQLHSDLLVAVAGRTIGACRFAGQRSACFGVTDIGAPRDGGPAAWVFDPPDSPFLAHSSCLALVGHSLRSRLAHSSLRPRQ